MEKLKNQLIEINNIVPNTHDEVLKIYCINENNL